MVRVWIGIRYIIQQITLLIIISATVTEISGADKLASLRGEMENFVGLSFETISSIGPNGAIIHYKPSQESNR